MQISTSTTKYAVHLFRGQWRIYKWEVFVPTYTASVQASARKSSLTNVMNVFWRNA